MDISKVTDINELKSLAYDAVVAIELNKNNLRVIEQRIMELQPKVETTPPTTEE